MDEQEFDQKIRESALRHESRMEKPLWNKEEVWNRVDLGLKKKNRSIWWKAAAVILILLSTGWSFAQWNNFRQYKLEKETELYELQQQLDQSIASQKNKLHEERTVINQQNQELDSLKKQILWFKEISRKKKFRKPTFVIKEEAENRGKTTYQKNLIDSLQNQLTLAQKILAKVETIRLSEYEKTAKPEITVVSKEVTPERHIYYISNHDQPQNTKKGRGFKIGIPGLPEDENIEYQSDHSIFKK